MACCCWCFVKGVCPFFRVVTVRSDEKCNGSDKCSERSDTHLSRSIMHHLSPHRRFSVCGRSDRRAHKSHITRISHTTTVRLSG